MNYQGCVNLLGITSEHLESLLALDHLLHLDSTGATDHNGFSHYKSILWFKHIKAKVFHLSPLLCRSSITKLNILNYFGCFYPVNV